MSDVSPDANAATELVVPKSRPSERAARVIG
jgi:hypothetical protein